MPFISYFQVFVKLIILQFWQLILLPYNVIRRRRLAMVGYIDEFVHIIDFNHEAFQPYLFLWDQTKFWCCIVSLLFVCLDFFFSFARSVNSLLSVLCYVCLATCPNSLNLCNWILDVLYIPPRYWKLFPGYPQYFLMY